MRTYQRILRSSLDHYYLVIHPSIDHKAYRDAAQAIGFILPRLREEDVSRHLPVTRRRAYFDIVSALEMLQCHLGNTVSEDKLQVLKADLEDSIRAFYRP